MVERGQDVRMYREPVESAEHNLSLSDIRWSRLSSPFTGIERAFYAERKTLQNSNSRREVSQGGQIQ